LNKAFPLNTTTAQIASFFNGFTGGITQKSNDNGVFPDPAGNYVLLQNETYNVVVPASGTQDLATAFANFSLTNYTPSELDENQFSFTAAIPEKIDLSIQDLHVAGIMLASANAVPFFNIKKPSESISALSNHVVNFLQNKKSGTTEDALHGRDDNLLFLIETICSLKIQRNAASESTIKASRPDGQLFKPGFPPTVIFEEKDTDGSIEAAKQDLVYKFTWLPHYEKLQFIIGIAIAGDSVVFGELSSTGFKSIHSLNIALPADSITCVQAVINISRWNKWLFAHNKLYPSTIPFNQTSTTE